MKKIFVIVPAILSANIAHSAGYVYIKDTFSGQGAGETHVGNPSDDTGGTQKYYTCNNSVTTTCNGYDHAAYKISYDSASNDPGTSAAPIKLTNCKFVSCACTYNKYLTSSNKCSNCSNNTVGLPVFYGIHSNSECQYCMPDKLMIKFSPAPGVNVTQCVDCSEHGTCNGGTSVSCDKGYYGKTGCTQCPSSGGVYGTTKSAGATEITQCYIPANTTFSFSDDAGSGTAYFKTDCFYTNN